jgi:hypothetical protein
MPMNIFDSPLSSLWRNGDDSATSTINNLRHYRSATPGARTKFTGSFSAKV